MVTAGGCGMVTGWWLWDGHRLVVVGWSQAGSCGTVAGWCLWGGHRLVVVGQSQTGGSGHRLVAVVTGRWLRDIHKLVVVGWSQAGGCGTVTGWWFCMQVKAMAVQDPFVLHHNIAQNINNPVRDQLVQEISNAAAKVRVAHRHSLHTFTHVTLVTEGKKEKSLNVPSCSAGF